jgi:hypothetical protein
MNRMIAKAIADMICVFVLCGALGCRKSGAVQDRSGSGQDGCEFSLICREQGEVNLC